MNLPKRKPLTLEVETAHLAAKGADPRDAALASRVVKAAHALQAAMDAAARAGLILEPNFQKFSGKVAEYGVETDCFLCKIAVYRKLI